MWYLKSHNSNSILLLFPLLAFFLSSFSLSPSLPPNDDDYFVSALWRTDTTPWRSTHTESALISPGLSDVCIMIRIGSHTFIHMAGAFCYLLSVLLFSYMFNMSWGHIRFSCLDVCFIIFGWSCLFWIQILEITINVLIKNRSISGWIFLKKLINFANR